MNLFFKILVYLAVIHSIGMDIFAQTADNKLVEKKSAIVIDYTNGQKILYSDKSKEKRYPASLTKMMTVYLLFDAIKNKKVTLNTKFRVSKYATAQAPSKLGLKVGAKISVSDAIKALFVKSANDVAVVVAEGLAGSVRNFCRLMNNKSRMLGMLNTHFENASGLPDLKQTSTAEDMAKLGMALFRDFPQYRNYLSLKKFAYGKKKYTTHCKILQWYKGADVAKTGYICASGFNLMVSASRYDKAGKSRRLFVVVMGGDTAKARDLYAGQLMDKYFDRYKISAQKPKEQLCKKSLTEQIGKSEMLEDVIHADNEIIISSKQAISNFNQMLDDLYKDNDECLLSEDEIMVHPKKHKAKKKKKA